MLSKADIGAASQQIPRFQTNETDVTNIARVCHEANRAVCIINGDLSQPSWDDAPEWQKESAKQGVRFHIANQYADGHASHDNWMEVKLRDGWRYGPKKNIETKEHPCLLPYHALPTSEKVKDDVFRSIVSGYIDAMKRDWRGTTTSALMAENTQEAAA